MPVVLITGAGRGIGASIAEAFAREIPDTKLALVARSEDELATVAESCRTIGAEAEIFPTDVTRDDEILSLKTRVTQAFGMPDVLINNAGSFAPGGVLEMSSDDFRLQVDINLTSAFLVTHAFLGDMVNRGSGDVFFTASVASIIGYPRSVAYGAAKHGLLGMARALRAETQELGIRVISLLPGATWTDSWSASGLPENRFIPPEDIADLVVAIHKTTGRTVVEEILIRPQFGDV